MRTKAWWTQWSVRLLSAAAILLVARLALRTARSAAEPAHGFVTHYTSSRLVLEGIDAAQFYDDAWFGHQVRRFEPTVMDIFGANPPTVAVTAVPLVLLEYRSARFLWTALSLIGWLIAVAFLARAVALRPPWTAALFCLAAWFQPIDEHLRHGQFHVLVLVLVLIAWRSLAAREPSAGVSLAAAWLFKASGLVFWPMLMAQRRWRALLAGATAIVVVTSACLWFAGPAAWAAFTERAATLNRSGSLSVTAYQTLPGMVRRLTVQDARWNPRPLLPIPAGRTLAWLAALAVLTPGLVIAARGRVSRDRARERAQVDANNPTHDPPPPRASAAVTRDGVLFAGFAALGLAVSPVSLDYHYVLAILPIAVLLGRAQDRIVSGTGLCLTAACALIALDLPYRSPGLADGALALFAYPKLAGALILWTLCLREARTKEQA